MKITCGTDIIEINRIKESVENLGEPFLAKIYTQEEIEYCESKKNAKYQHYAARFAAKEAVFKAISNSLENKFEIGWKNIQIKNEQNGRPKIELLECDSYKIKNIDISISHCKEYAVAMVVVTF